MLNFYKFIKGFLIENASDQTKQLQVEISDSATTDTKTTLTAAQTADRTITLPDASGTLVSGSSADVLTNKDIDGGTASNTQRITIPKNTFANITALTRKEGTLLYASDLDKLYYDNGIALVEVNSAVGGGVTSVATGTGLTGGPITTSGTISLIVPVSIANGGTNNTTFTNKSVPYYDGTKLAENNANFFWNNVDTSLVIGANASPSPGGLTITKSRDSLGGAAIINPNAGTAAFAGIFATNGTHSTIFSQLGANFTGFGGYAAISQLAGNGLILNTPTAKQIILSQNNVTQVEVTTTGILSLTNQIKIAGGVPGSGKVLTSDAVGLATWETPTAGTGTANTLAFYNSSGNLDSNANAEFNETTNSMSFGTGPISATGTGSLAFGEFTVGTTGEILAQYDGSLAHGLIAAGANADIISGAGSHAFGYINTGSDGHITAGGSAGSGDEGSLAFGRVTTNNSANIESVKGSLAFGNTSFGSIQSLGSGGLAFGYTPGTGSIRATSGSFGCLAFGVADGTGPTIHASGNGSFAGGQVATAGGTGITASNTSLAFGYATNFNVSATGTGSMAVGYAQTGNVTTSGDNSTVRGDQLTSTGTLATSFGLGLTNGTYANFMMGRFASDAGTAGSWVSTDSVFQIGNGASAGSPATAFQIFKDGKLTTTGAQRHTAIRAVAAAASLSARTDGKILLDLAGVTGNITLPAAEDGLEFSFGFKGAGAAVYTLVTSGGNTLDANLPATITAPLKITALSGVWYSIG